MRVGQGVAIVEWFSYLTGLPNGQAMIALSEMHGADTRWRFYGSPEELDGAWGRAGGRACGLCQARDGIGRG